MDALFERLCQWERAGAVPFHMPGHKRNTALAPYLKKLSAGLDVTEIPGFDDLHAPEELLKTAMEQAAALYGSEHAFFCVNGSTGGILAAIRAATRRGDRVLVARNCHKAVYHALELCGLLPIYLVPPRLPGFGCAGSLPPSLVEEALESYADIRLVILTSPSYEGVLCDIASICRVAHAREIPVFVDEAHGAHLGLTQDVPAGAIAQGADLVVQSAHKTLPSLTQTAFVHLCSARISRDELARQLGIFQTSSPSYLLLASMEGCVSLLTQQRVPLFAAWRRRLAQFSARMSALKKLRLLQAGQTEIFALDPSKLVIGTAGTDLSGIELAEHLRERYHIQVEMALEDYAVAMTSPADTDEMMEALAGALLELDEDCERCAVQESMPPLPLPCVRLSMEEALALPWQLVPQKQAVRAISAAAIWAYPPGIPLVLPGEEISGELVENLSHMEEIGIKLVATRGALPERLAVVELPCIFER